MELIIKRVKICVCLIKIGSILRLVLRVLLGQSVTNILHLNLCIQRAQPNVRIGSAMVVIVIMVVFFLIMIVIVFLLFKLKKFDVFAGLNCCKFCAGTKSIKYVLDPVLHTSTVVNQEVCFLDSLHILAGWLPIMWLSASWNEACYLSMIASNALCKIVHRIKTCNNAELLLVFVIRSSFLLLSLRLAASKNSTHAKSGSYKCATTRNGWIQIHVTSPKTIKTNMV